MKTKEDLKEELANLEKRLSMARCSYQNEKAKHDMGTAGNEEYLDDWANTVRLIEKRIKAVQKELVALAVEEMVGLDNPEDNMTSSEKFSPNR